MIILKTEEEIKIMKKAGQIAAGALREVIKRAQVGVSTLELDKIAEDFIRSHKAVPSFQKVKGYYHTICATPNDYVVHGIPGRYRLKSGDILGVDIGAYYQGFHSDTATTVLIGENFDSKKKKFLETGKKALNLALKEAKAGKHVGDISWALQSTVEKEGYNIVKELVGHGVGRDLHEDPAIPGFGKKGQGPLLKEGMVIAVEVIYNMGKEDIALLPDGWTLVTQDQKPSGLFEHTIALTKNGSIVLTL